MTFTAATWNVAQTVTVTGVDDLAQDGDVTYSIVTAAATSPDAGYAGLDPADVSVTNRDNDIRWSFYTLAPCRVIDTRTPSDGPALSDGVDVLVAIRGACGIPVSGRAVALNVTVTGPTGSGHLVLFPGGSSTPPSSTISFSPGRTRANNAIVTLGPDGTIAIHPVVSGSGTTHAIIDVNGYFE